MNMRMDLTPKRPVTLASTVKILHDDNTGFGTTLVNITVPVQPYFAIGIGIAHRRLGRPDGTSARITHHRGKVWINALQGFNRVAKKSALRRNDFKSVTNGWGIETLQEF